MEQFLTELQTLTRDCEFRKIKEMISDRIVIGVYGEKITEKLFDEGSMLTLEKAISIARSYESSQKDLKAMANKFKEETVHFIRKSKQQNSDEHHPQHTKIQDTARRRAPDTKSTTKQTK